MLDRPFRVGDRIQLATGEIGDVQAIGMRATPIKTRGRDDPDRAQQPAREGAAREPEPAHAAHRHRVEVGVAFGSDLAKVQGRAARRRAAAPLTWTAIARPSIQITRFARIAVNFRVVFWARDYAEQGLARSEVYEAMHDGLAEAGIAIPLPTRRIIQEPIQEIGNAKARVYVTLKKSVFDPQGRTIHEALRSLGYDGVADVRQGKFFEVDLEVDGRRTARGRRWTRSPAACWPTP